MITSLALAMTLTAMPVKNLYSFKMNDINGRSLPLSAYKGKVVLVVNTASQCGNTPQYAALQSLYEANQKAGLVILGIPSNDFGGQEPGTEKDIKEFCTANYKVTFPMTQKSVVSGDNKIPLYAWLTSVTDNKEVEWNFAKFLVGRNGEVLKRFSARMKPDNAEITSAIKAALETK